MKLLAGVFSLWTFLCAVCTSRKSVLHNTSRVATSSCFFLVAGEVQLANFKKLCRCLTSVYALQELFRCISQKLCFYKNISRVWLKMRPEQAGKHAYEML